MLGETEQESHGNGMRGNGYVGGGGVASKLWEGNEGKRRCGWEGEQASLSKRFRRRGEGE
jgi:hypothetical protein